MPGADDLVIEDTADLPDANNLPRSEEENLQLLALLESKSAKTRESNRRLRLEKFKASKARRQAQPPPPEPQPLPESTQSTGSTAGLRQQVEERISKLHARFEVAAAPADALSLLRHLESAAAAWPEEDRRKLEAVLELGRQRLDGLKEREQESDSTDSDARENDPQEEELRQLRTRKEALAEELARWACDKHSTDYNGDFASLCMSSTRAVEDGESTSASRGTSASRDLQKDHPSAPSSARSCSDAGCRSLSLDFGMPQSQLEEPEASKPSTPGKGKCKGKGKGKGVPAHPPPPKAGAKAAAKASAKAAAAPQANNFQNFFWQVSKGEGAGTAGQEFDKRYEAARVVQDCPEQDCMQEPLVVPQPPVTVFTPLSAVDEMPQRVLDLYWRKRERGRLDVELQEDATELAMLDEKALQMLGISLKRHEHQNKGLKGFEAIFSIKMAILKCDFKVVCIECLSVIRTVVRQHETDGKPVCVYVAEHGEAALNSLKCAQEHCLVYELSKVPQIVDRLECMLFHETFEDSLCSNRKALAAHRRALDMLNTKRETIQRFFMTALRLGQSLNRRSRSASQAPNGFQLASLEKLSETKSTKLPKLSVLHFVLALMSHEDAQTLFDVEDLALLQEAAVLKTHKVFTDCVELVQGLYGVQHICNTGQYVRQDGETISMERRRRSLPANRSPAAEHEDEAIDDDDHFFEVMKDFTDTNLEAAEDLGEGAFNLILAYKELAIYFDDMRNVYPPPKTDNDPRKDLVEVFVKLAEQIQQHREQVESEKLRDLLSHNEAQVNEGRGVSLPGAALRTRANTAPDFSPPTRASESSDSTRTPSRSRDVTASLSFGPSIAELAMTPEAGTERERRDAAEAASQDACSFRSNLASRFGNDDVASAAAD